jgi:peptide/nickel transport system permease protein
VLQYVAGRIVIAIPTLLIISIICFVLIQLPPGDFMTAYLATLTETGDTVDKEIVEAFRKQYGLDKPLYVQYLIWIKGVVVGDFGVSFMWNKPVSELIWTRLGFTLVVSLSSLVFTYAVAVPIGIYSATHQYSVGDYIATFLGFVGLATPNFLLALVLMWFFYISFGLSVGGLFSPALADAPWSLSKLIDLISHLWIPMIVIGTAGTCGLIRVMRGCLLDELRKQYVVTARAKGVKEGTILFKYPVRMALNPLVSTIGWALPRIFSGATITAVVLSLPTVGPLLLRSLLSQDMYLAGSFLLLLATLTVIGTLLSDILLAFLDPRIRFERRASG